MTAIFDGLADFLGQILAFFYSVIPNFGISIILLVILVMLVTFPLTAKQARSMIEMQRLQPLLKELQKKHKDDRQKLNEETMKLFQEHQVNPFMGCLPLIIQMPIFFGLFRVTSRTVAHVPTNSDLYRSLCKGISDCSLSDYSPPHFLGMNLSLKAIDAHSGVLDALPYFLLVGVVVCTSLLQIAQTRRMQRGNVNPQMKMIATVLPLAFGVGSLFFPSGVVLYFFVSNTWRLGQQEVILRKITLPGLQETERLKQQKEGKEKTEQPPPEPQQRRKRKRK